MNAVERVKSICKERKIAISKLESDCGFSNAYISQLRKGTFPNDRLQIISDYLGVSIDYLMTGQEKRFSAEAAELDVDLIMIDREVKEYAIMLNKLPKEKQEHIFELIKLFNK